MSDADRLDRIASRLGELGLRPVVDCGMGWVVSDCPVCQVGADEGYGSLTATDDGRVSCEKGCPEELIRPALAPLGSDRAGGPSPQRGAVDDERGQVAQLRFTSAAELRAQVPDEPEWLWQGYVAAGAITLIAGKPKAGKSTLTCALVEAVDAGADAFLDHAVRGGSVVYVSEEGGGTLVHKLPASDGVRVLTRDTAWPKPSWPQVVQAATAEAKRVGAVLLVIDALAFWAAMAEGQENDAAAAQTAMSVLGAATSAGLAVVLVHHQRKSGGTDGDAVRGSGAIFGAVDALVELERPDGDAPAGQRRLVASGRWPQMAPVLLVDRDGTSGTWRVIGEAAGRGEAETLGAQERILRAIPAEEPGATEPEIVELVGVDKRKLSTPLRDLVDDGRVVRDGGGRKGDPYRYFRAATDSAPGFCPASGQRAASRSKCCPSPTGGSIEFRFHPCPRGRIAGRDAGAARGGVGQPRVASHR